MFDSYVIAKNTKQRRWVSVLILGSVAAHSVFLVALLVRGFWVIEKLTGPQRQVAMVTSLPPPPPPPPAAASARKPEAPKTPRKRIPKDITQPPEKPLTPEELQVEISAGPDEVGDPNGVVGGDPSGMVGGDPTSVPSLGDRLPAMQPPPPLPKQEKPRTIAQHAIEQQRVSGDPAIHPDESTRLAIHRDGKNEVIATFKMCLSAEGTVTQVTAIRRSGYESYDRKIESTIRTWRYNPLTVDGTPVPVCSALTFVYRLR